MSRIRRKIIVMSGKGGVGKSTVAVNLAAALTLAGKRVGLLDADIHGPSIPTMLGLEREAPQSHDGDIVPVEVGDLKVLSLGFFLPSPDDAVIWRGPMKMTVIRQFLRDAAWGDLDFLIIDSPPGTGDEPLSVCQLIGKLDGAVIVTTPQKVAAVDVRKSVNFCRQLQVPVLGIVENMSGFACPRCGEITHVLRSGGGRSIAETMRIPFLGAIPMDPAIADACDDGRVFLHHYATSPTAKIMRDVIAPIVRLDGDHPNAQADASAVAATASTMSTTSTKPTSTNARENPTKENNHMKIAIPLADGRLAMHFGHCERFALIDVDTASKTITGRTDIEAPPHQPGLLPPWLAERGATVILAGGMGQRARSLFAEQGIEVVVGAAADAPEKLVAAYLAGTLQTGDNVCDH